MIEEEEEEIGNLTIQRRKRKVSEDTEDLEEDSYTSSNSDVSSSNDEKPAGKKLYSFKPK